MTEPINDPSYWRRRLEKAKADPSTIHRAIFQCPLETWQAIECKHREILSRLTRANDSILDAGCGWGRLLSLMPRSWQGQYLGVDISHDFIEMAWLDHPDRNFYRCNMTRLPRFIQPKQFDWAIMISIKHMVKRNLGDETWEQMESELRRVSKRLLFLEYDVNDQGTVINCNQEVTHE